MKPQGRSPSFYTAAVIIALVLGVLLFQCRKNPSRVPPLTVVPGPTPAATPTRVRTVTPTPPFAVAAAINPPPATRPDMAAIAAPAVTPTPIALQDGKTIDYSSGIAVVRDSAKEKAIIDAALKEMDAAASGITFGPVPVPTKR